MAPVRPQAFSVNVLLDRRGQAQPDSIVVSKDILDDTDADLAGRRYIALSSLQSQNWSLYLARPESSDSGLHSTVWLPGAVYNEVCDREVLARPAKPIELSSIMIAVPATTYHLVYNNLADLQVMSQNGYVFRTNESVDINGYRGHISFCEPVRQGVISSSTETIIAKAPEEPEPESVGPYGLIDEDSDDDLGISNVGFSGLLTSSVLSRPAVSASRLGSSLLSGSEQTIPSRTFPAEILTRQIPPSQIFPSPSELEDDNFRVFASMHLLIELGFFSGDQVELGVSTDNEGLLPRSMKIYSLPSDYAASRVDCIFLPPTLFHNLSLTKTKTKPEIGLYMRKLPKKIEAPIAKAVTLGRIPSPASTDRSLQHAFLLSLKSHFEGCRRVTRVGDVLLLGIDETLARVTASDGPENEVLADYTQSFKGHADTFGWFKILDVEIDAENEAKYAGDVRIDASNTRMVQSGLVKSRIPPLEEWADFYGVPHLARPSYEPDSPYTRVTDLVNSTFSRTARASLACASILLHGARGSGKRTLVSSVAASLGMHFLELNCYDIVGETDVKTEAHLRLRFEKAGQCSPCILLLRNVDALAKKKDDQESGQESTMRFILADCLKGVAMEAGDEFPVAVVATTGDKEKVPDGVLGCFRHDIEIVAPSEATRHEMLLTLVKGLPLAPDVSVQSLAVRSAALVAIDLVNVVRRAQNFAHDRMDDLAADLGQYGMSDLQTAGMWITAADFEQAISEARRNYSDSIGAPKIPNVTWDDVGGLASVKDDIMDTIQLPLERPELFASGMKKRSGILFYGPPGTGKTLLAKAVATSFSLNFFSVKGPEILNMYIGESEANVRRVFQRARDAKPCVVFFDELDSVAPKRGNQGDSGGVMDRIVSQLLSELDGMSEGTDGGGGVFVIGATNRPDLLDPALLRPGRFDKMLYLGVSDTDDAQLNILQALTRKFKLSENLDLRQIARACPFTYTGADFYALCSDAMLKAMTRQAAAVDAKVKALDPPRTTQYFFDQLATKSDVEVVVSESDFRAALSELIPSVSQSELDHYKKVQAQFSPVKEEKVKVDKGKGKIVETNGHGVNGTNGHFQNDQNNDDDDMYS